MNPNEEQIQTAKGIVMEQNGLHQGTCEQTSQMFSEGLCDCSAISIISQALASERMKGREEQKVITDRYARMIELMADGVSYDEALQSTKPE